MKFQPVNSNMDFPAMERDILEQWKNKDIVAKYLKRNKNSDKRHSFIDGPITANNPMGVHHAWGRTYKDLFLRYRTMQGFKQRYQNGFDGQGLWIEVEVEKELGFKSKKDIEDFGIDKFVDLCKKRVEKFSDIITNQSVRLGYWMDWDDSYQTMSDENNYTIWLFLKKCEERGWIYEGRDVMPWCSRCGTGLSEHEIVTEGYKEIAHPGLFVQFPIEGNLGRSLLVWTTTPWTLTSNVAVAVHPDRDYVRVRQGEGQFFVIKTRLSVLKGEYEVIEEVKGRDLVGLRYRGPFDELPAQAGVEHRVIEWEDVSESEGTGLVHIAPGAGKEDFALGKKNQLETIAPLDESGHFVEGFKEFSGKSVFEINESIYENLRNKGLFYHLESYSHRYPVCWRCDTELVFRLVDEWFISMDELRGLIDSVAQKVNWMPKFGLQRELDWLRNMDDWMISKKRYWGLALPIYKCDCGNFDVMGSKEELKDRAIEGWSEFEGHSPHRPWIDSVRVQCSKCGSEVSRIQDVGNPWLDAGIVTFSTLGYRHNRDEWKQWFPADWISESFPGQYRNWFYSLLTMSTVLENSEPSKSIHSYALMRDENGQEMHKSKGNAIWFEDAAERMGVDALRWLYARQNPASNMNLGYSTADDVRRRFLIPLWNVYSFFVTYANIDQYDPSISVPELEERPDLDRWIVSELHTLVAEVTESLDEYSTDRAARSAERFIGFLSNWYVRRSRRRFWKSGVVNGVVGADSDKLSAYATLYECLMTLVKLLAPFIPFMTESIYQNISNPLKTGVMIDSVHLESYPKPDTGKIDERLSDSTRLAMRLSSLGRSARSKAGIKVRQPLDKAMFKLRSQSDQSLLDDVASQVQDELNVKEIIPLDDESEVIELKIRPNLSLLGPKYGSEMSKIIKELNLTDPLEVSAKVNAGQQIEINGYLLDPDEVLVDTSDNEGYAVVSDAGYTVAISIDISPDLALEGLARELVHRIQNMRRSAGFNISDYIVTYYDGNNNLEELMTVHGNYIREETLSIEVVNGAPESDSYTESHSVDGFDLLLGVRRERQG